jgi:hypothetical protein
MAKTLSQIGVETNYLVRAWHVSQSIDALTGADDYDITISGSLTTTGSLYFNGLETSSTNDVLTYDSTTGEVTYTPTIDLVVGTALTASYVDLVAGPNIVINQVGTSFEISSSAGGGFVTYPEFNNFTSSYNTGSFTGSFTGNLLGTASYINLVAGPNITINQTGNAFEISSSAGAINTGSFLVTASIASNTITFTKGDSSTFPIVILGGNGGGASNNLTNIVPTTSTYQIPSGNYRIIIDGDSPSVGFSDYYIKLPTSSYSIGDVLEITGKGTWMGLSYSIYVTQPDTLLQIIDISGTNSTLGLIGSASIYHRDTIRLTCVNSNSGIFSETQWLVSSYNSISFPLNLT